MRRAKALAALAAFFALLWFAGDADYQEAQRQAEEYSRNVCAGVWPDYKNRNPVCGPIFDMRQP